jgi:hypothetical protein
MANLRVADVVARFQQRTSATGLSSGRQSNLFHLHRRPIGDEPAEWFGAWGIGSLPGGSGNASANALRNSIVNAALDYTTIKWTRFIRYLQYNSAVKRGRRWEVGGDQQSVLDDVSVWTHLAGYRAGSLSYTNVASVNAGHTASLSEIYTLVDRVVQGAANVGTSVTLEYAICHSSCHDSCHSSRERR